MVMGNRRPCSIILVRKIIELLHERGAMTRTGLSQASNIHYSKLVEQLSLLKQKQYLDLDIEEGKVVVKLTEKGREFGIKLLELEG